MIIDNGNDKVVMFDVKLPETLLIASQEDEALLEELRGIQDMMKVLEKNKERIQKHFKEKMGDIEELYTSNGGMAATLTTIDGRDMVNTQLLRALFPDATKACVYKTAAYKRFCLK